MTEIESTGNDVSLGDAASYVISKRVECALAGVEVDGRFQCMADQYLIRAEPVLRLVGIRVSLVPATPDQLARLGKTARNGREWPSRTFLRLRRGASHSQVQYE